MLGGLLSGWKTTSIFGSLINASLALANIDYNKIKLKFITVLGDDIDLSIDKTTSK